MVKEKLVCYAVIGMQKAKSLVMNVNIICEFIAPLIQLSAKQLIYRLEKVSGAVLGGPGSARSHLHLRSRIDGKPVAPTPEAHTPSPENSESKPTFL